jgi:hypothetical protein
VAMLWSVTAVVVAISGTTGDDVKCVPITDAVMIVDADGNLESNSIDALLLGATKSASGSVCDVVDLCCSCSVVAVVDGDEDDGDERPSAASFRLSNWCCDDDDDDD